MSGGGPLVARKVNAGKYYVAAIENTYRSTVLPAIAPGATAIKHLDAFDPSVHGGVIRFGSLSGGYIMDTAGALRQITVRLCKQAVWADYVAEFTEPATASGRRILELTSFDLTNFSPGVDWYQFLAQTTAGGPANSTDFEGVRIDIPVKGGA